MSATVTSLVPPLQMFLLLIFSVSLMLQHILFVRFALINKVLCSLKKKAIACEGPMQILRGLGPPMPPLSFGLHTSYLLNLHLPGVTLAQAVQRKARLMLSIFMSTFTGIPSTVIKIDRKATEHRFDKC
jgi:hypothetical protein